MKKGYAKIFLSAVLAWRLVFDLKSAVADEDMRGKLAPLNSSEKNFSILDEKETHFGFQLEYSPYAIKTVEPYGVIGPKTLKGLTLAAEVSPSFLQGFWGDISFGPTFSWLYVGSPILQAGDPQFKSLGGFIRYAAKVDDWITQILVPSISFSVESLFFNIGTGLYTSGVVVVRGISPGILVNIGWLEPHSARELFKRYGVKKTYLEIEYRLKEGKSRGNTLLSKALTFGLQFVF